MPKTIFSAPQECLQELLRQIRMDAGFTQGDVAQRLKQPQSFVSKYESGERRLDVIELRQICGILGISLAKFVEKFEKALNK
jgi:transcriptional regulator with XRE-family HTH domain